jgi:hypothetical protein
MTEKAKEPIRRVKVKLLAETHTHAGESKKRGDQFDLRDDQAKRLAEAKIVEILV